MFLLVFWPKGNGFLFETFLFVSSLSETRMNYLVIWYLIVWFLKIPFTILGKYKNECGEAELPPNGLKGIFMVVQQGLRPINNVPSVFRTRNQQIWSPLDFRLYRINDGVLVYNTHLWRLKSSILSTISIISTQVAPRLHQGLAGKATRRGYPRQLRFDNDPELISK